MRAENEADTDQLFNTHFMNNDVFLFLSFCKINFDIRILLLYIKKV